MHPVRSVSSSLPAFDYKTVIIANKIEQIARLVYQNFRNTCAALPARGENGTFLQRFKTKPGSIRIEFTFGLGTGNWTISFRSETDLLL